ncbi:hypothetical protein ACLQ2R_08290 [Streptosporangium sp. DT93]|uniref:hypothetical protein n=1 Tax=Streptosporangium sp. DT93 TaxID=3393428 RepID=UPI003CF17141
MGIPDYYVVHAAGIPSILKVDARTGSKITFIDQAEVYGNIEKVAAGEDDTFYLAVRPDDSTACASVIYRTRMGVGDSPKVDVRRMVRLRAGGHVGALAVTRDGSRLAYVDDGCGSGTPQTLTVHDVKTNMSESWSITTAGKNLSAKHLAWAGQDRIALSVIEPCTADPGEFCLPDTVVRMLDTRDPGRDLARASELRRWREAGSDLPIAFSADASSLFTPSDDKEGIEETSIADGNVLGEFDLSGEGGRIVDLAMDAAGQHLLVESTTSLDHLDVRLGRSATLPWPLDVRRPFDVAW